MHYFLQLLKRYRIALLFGVLETVALVLFISTDSYLKARTTMAWSGLELRLTQHLTRLENYFSLNSENHDLRRENIALRARLESQAARSFDYIPADCSELARFSSIPARVVTNNVTSQYNFFTLNRGSDQGVKVHMPVVSQGSIAGVVVATTPRYCAVISLLNKDFKVSARLARSHYFGSLIWDGSAVDCGILEHIPHHIRVNIGDTVETSGYSTIFPQGIPVGTVKSVKKGGTFLSLRVKLFTQFQSLDHVYILQDAHCEQLEMLENQVERTLPNE